MGLSLPLGIMPFGERPLVTWVWVGLVTLQESCADNSVNSAHLPERSDLNLEFGANRQRVQYALSSSVISL